MLDTRTIKVEGLREVNKALRQIDDKVNKQALRDAHKALAEKVVRSALPHVPVKSGRLLQSVKALASPSAARGRAGGARVPYAPAVHWGTGPRAGLRGPHNIQRRPFLQRAVFHVEEEAVREFADEIQRIIDRIAR